MKNILFIFITISILLSSLSANEIYAKLGTVKEYSKLHKVKAKLNNLGYKIFITKGKNLYMVYSGPFANKKEAYTALNLIKQRVASSAILVVFPKKKVLIPKQKKAITDEVIKKDKQIPKPKTKEPKQKEVVKSKANNNNFFIGIVVGSSTLNIEEKTTGDYFPLDVELENNGLSYGLELGYNINKNIFMTLNYQNAILENINFDNVFTTLNYKFEDIYTIYPYVGVVAGISIMQWDNYPIDSKETIGSAYSGLGGVQMGVSIPIIYDFEIYLLYKYLIMQHKTNISTSTATKELKYNSEQNFNVGIKFSF